jgi:hypothetical protein
MTAQYFVGSSESHPHCHGNRRFYRPVLNVTVALVLCDVRAEAEETDEHVVCERQRETSVK